MASMAGHYGTSVRDEIKLFTAWPIGTRVELGDVGFLHRRGKLFERRANLGNFGVKYSVSKAANTTDFDFALSRNLRMKFKGAGEPPPVWSSLLSTDVGVAIGFGRGTSVIVQAHTIESAIDNLQGLESDLIRVSTDAKSRWHREFVVVTAVYESTGTTVLLSSGKEASVDITASAAIGVPFDLAGVNLGLSAAYGSKKLVSALARTGFVPFFQIHHLIGQFWGSPRLDLYG